MIPSVFEYHSYKKYIQAYVKGLGEPWGYWNKVAAAMNCQPSYLSRCLKDKTHLTVDQVLALCQFWSLIQEETEYLIHLLEKDRAATPAAQKFFQGKLEDLKNQNENLKQRLKRSSLEEPQDQSLYYSHWLWMAVHFATSIPSLQTLEALSQRFNSPKEQILPILEKLKAMSLVSKTGDRWSFHSGEFHLGKDSPLITHHHSNWRGRALNDSQNPNSKGIHYSAVHTLSKRDYEKLKAMLVQFIDDTRKVIEPSPEEEIIAINLDIFRI